MEKFPTFPWHGPGRIGVRVIFLLRRNASSVNTKITRNTCITRLPSMAVPWVGRPTFICRLSSKGYKRMQKCDRCEHGGERSSCSCVLIQVIRTELGLSTYKVQHEVRCVQPMRTRVHIRARTFLFRMVNLSCLLWAELEILCFESAAPTLTDTQRTDFGDHQNEGRASLMNIIVVWLILAIRRWKIIDYGLSYCPNFPAEISVRFGSESHAHARRGPF
ncbi:hypothetical protein PM082_017213 [Marasmius tenuissimus]|nr:hypothetical protein PM082_017213 [Marasmius tenuissimus]